MNKTLILTAAAAMALAPSAFAQTEAQTVCSRGAVTRSIEVISPGKVGAKCDVVYSKPNEGLTSQTPYHANNDYNYCAEKADELAQTLTDAGWTCVAVETDLAALDAPVAPPAAEPAPTRLAAAEPTPDVAPAAAPVADAQPAPEPVKTAEVAPKPEPKAEPAPTPAEPKPAAPVIREAAVSREPERLAPAPAPAAVATKLAAAEPAPRPAATPTRVSAAVPGRPPEEAVRAVLEAQQAAWNAGDIQGFMAGYWKSDDLRFASGAAVTRGYKATLNGYRKRYPDAAAMGQLAFSDLDVQLIGDDHAIVFGAWRVTKADGETPNGLFTLVMRKMDGVWRVVHDHTSAAS